MNKLFNTVTLGTAGLSLIFALHADATYQTTRKNILAATTIASLLAYGAGKGFDINPGDDDDDLGSGGPKLTPIPVGGQSIDLSALGFDENGRTTIYQPQELEV